MIYLFFFFSSLHSIHLVFVHVCMGKANGILSGCLCLLLHWGCCIGGVLCGVSMNVFYFFEVSFPFLSFFCVLYSSRSCSVINQWRIQGFVPEVYIMHI